MGWPIALATKGTVRLARGLASMMYGMSSCSTAVQEGYLSKDTGRVADEVGWRPKASLPLSVTGSSAGFMATLLWQNL
jgi:hypothetical protein